MFRSHKQALKAPTKIAGIGKWHSNQIDCGSMHLPSGFYSFCSKQVDLLQSGVRSMNCFGAGIFEKEHAPWTRSGWCFKGPGSRETVHLVFFLRLRGELSSSTHEK